MNYIKKENFSLIKVCLPVLMVANAVGLDYSITLADGVGTIMRFERSSVDDLSLLPLLPPIFNLDIKELPNQVRLLGTTVVKVNAQK